MEIQKHVISDYFSGVGAMQVLVLQSLKSLQSAGFQTVGRVPKTKYFSAKSCGRMKAGSYNYFDAFVLMSTNCEQSLNRFDS